MSSKDYWNKREVEALTHYITNEKQYSRHIKNIYSDMFDEIQAEIDGFFGRYATKDGITIAEAKKRVSKLNMELYERKAKRYVKDRDFTKQANEEMRLYNLTMKVNRLEMLKANIGLHLVSGHSELEKYMQDILQGRTEEELKRQAGILGKTIQNNDKKADAIVNASFHNATFSDRIWMYQDLMKAELSKLLKNGLIQGKNPRALAKDLKKMFGVSTSNAERLMKTELARVQTSAQQQSYDRNGFEMYTFMANAGCCPICAALDGKHFKVKDMLPGKNAAPMHPNCRCSSAPYEDSNEYEAWLDFLDKGGTTKEWNEGAKSIWNNKNNKNRHKKKLKYIEKSSKSDKIKQKYSFKIINGKHSIDEDIGTNEKPTCNPNFHKDNAYRINCQRCVQTYEYRRRGYDVIAKPYQNKNNSIVWGNECFLDKDGNKPQYTFGKTESQIKEELKNAPDGARYSIYVEWKKEYGGSAHVFVAEKENGVVRYIDPQTGNKDSKSHFEKANVSKFGYLRMDDKTLTDDIDIVNQTMEDNND